MMTTIGIDVGGTNIKAVVRRSDGQILERQLQPTPEDAEGIIEAATDIARRWGQGAPVGLALAGLVDHAAGVLRWAPHLPGVDVEFRSRLEGALGVRVTVENDANSAAVAEQRQGAAQGARSMVMLTLGTGIGLGVIDDGRVVRGRAHAGEVGHVIVDPGGDLCACGRRGCWETKVSGRRFDVEARRLLGPEATAADLVEAARTGKEEAIEVLVDAGTWLAAGIEALVLVLDPEVVVVGGAAAAAGDLLLDPARRRLSATEGAGHRIPAAVRAGILGADAGAVGAAILASEETGK